MYMLPDNPETFFTWYHDKVTNNDISLQDALEELRGAWKAYPEHRKRISQMADVVKVGMRKRPEFEKPIPTELEKNVMETML